MRLRRLTDDATKCDARLAIFHRIKPLSLSGVSMDVFVPVILKTKHNLSVNKLLKITIKYRETHNIVLA